jgi:hypothetical protein
MNTLKLFSNLFSSGNFTKNLYQPEDNLPYHRFNAYDYEKLLNPSDIGQEFVYKNQFNESLKFKLIKSTLGKKTFKTMKYNSFWQKQFCYDQQEMQLELSNSGKQKLTFVLKKFPQLLQQTSDDFKYGNHSKFLSTIQYQDWNDNNLIVVDYTKPVATMIIKSVFYTKVRCIEIKTTTESLKIYFDEQKGIIGFDDIYGKIWRLDN